MFRGKMINWIKKLFTRKEKEPFEKFLKELLKERRKALYDNSGTDDTGPH